jgi:hypothetical protein
MKTALLLVIIVVFMGFPKNSDMIELKDPIGTYELDFNKIYKTYATLDIETAVTLPDGYTFGLVKPGTDYFIYAYSEQNRLMFSKQVTHSIVTNIQTNVITPNGQNKSLVFQIEGGKKSPRVQLIRFLIKDGPKTEKTALKELYQYQLETKLKSQEMVLRDKIKKELLTNLVPVELKIKKRYKGATINITGMIFHESNAFVYCQSHINDSKSDIIQLKGIKKNKMNSTIPAKLWESTVGNNGIHSYVYKIPVVFKNDQQIQFIVSIWSKEFVLKTKL